MNWAFIIAIIVAIPVILFPVALIWYLNVAGIAQFIKAWRKRKVTTEEPAKVNLPVENDI